jgi:hypothetical protein
MSTAAVSAASVRLVMFGMSDLLFAEVTPAVGGL